MSHLLSRAALCCLVALSLAGCSEHARQMFRNAGAAAVGTFVTSTPASKPRPRAERPRKTKKD